LTDLEATYLKSGVGGAGSFCGREGGCLTSSQLLMGLHLVLDLQACRSGLRLHLYTSVFPAYLWEFTWTSPHLPEPRLASVSRSSCLCLLGPAKPGVCQVLGGTSCSVQSWPCSLRSVKILFPNEVPHTSRTGTSSGSGGQVGPPSFHPPPWLSAAPSSAPSSSCAFEAP
jgi:hypothetical protein